MTSFRDLSVKHKLNLIITVITGLVLVLATSAMLANDLLKFRRNMVTELYTLADLISLTSSAGLLFYDSATAEENLAALQANPEIHQAHIFTLDGKLFASYYKVENAPETLPVSATLADYYPGEPGGVTDEQMVARHFFRNGHVDVFKRIVYDGKALGTVYLQSGMGAFYANLKWITVIVLIVLAVSLVFAFALASMVQKLVTSPIYRLLETMDYITRKQDYSVRETKISNDELGTLCDGFNKMLERIESRDHQLEQANQAADAANRAKSVFLANMSHELRTPLNAVLGFSEMLARDPGTSPVQQEKLTVINRSGTHLLEMINDVLDLSKIEAGRVELEPAVFHLPSLLEDLGRIFELRAESAGLHFLLELETGLAEYVEADNGKLRQILINLLGNAVKFTVEGGISLLARTQPNVDDPAKLTLHLEVEDSGPGIPPEQQNRIFEPFIQAGHSPSRAKGTGLGLAITKSFIELMGGVIHAESRAAGALFRVEIPVVAADAHVEEENAQRNRPAVTGLQPDQPAWHILVVEDDPDSRLLLSSLLLEVGFTVQEAENGQEAVARFEDWHPHFIWMDMRMPVMDGYEATRRIRKLPGGDAVKIAALTASVFKEQRTDIVAAGCDEVLHKPFRAHEIFAAMERGLGVRYHYAETHPEPAPASPLRTEDFTSLPQDIVQALLAAALECDPQKIAAAEAAVRAVQPVLADSIRVLTAKYRYAELTELCEQALDQI